MIYYSTSNNRPWRPMKFRRPARLDWQKYRHSKAVIGQIIIEYDSMIGSGVWIQLRVGLWLGVRINTGGCAGSLLITMYIGLDPIWHRLVMNKGPNFHVEIQTIAYYYSKLEAYVKMLEFRDSLRVFGLYYAKLVPSPIYIPPAFTPGFRPRFQDCPLAS